MKVKILINEQDYNAALKRAEEIFDVKPNSLQCEELALLLKAIKDYEDRYHPVSNPGNNL